eukprot:TRINITY_DN9230_c0_g1_i4.p1 TRINITY_DN9230_c0_g1~~TRINITY_DN9230_c0_g1_i4.p1  ORF type:complete len:154 (+),score=9.18 TRINITY_DN9230_c0_g1_i4:119-580(+)
MTAYVIQQQTPMYVNACPPLQTMPVAPSPGFQPMYAPQPAIATPVLQPVMQPVFRPPPVPCPPPVNTSVMTTQQNLDETGKPLGECKKCPYCGMRWNPIMVSKLTTGNAALGTILGLCGIIPGVLYCLCTRKKLNGCQKCRKVEKDDDYCCEC